MCGLLCDECVAFIATQRDDDAMRHKVVKMWSTEDEQLKIEDVDCDGCMIGGKLYSYCAVCDVRKCGTRKNVKNCGNCEKFPCNRLETLWNGFRTVSAKEARTNLEEKRARNLK
ncbi:MAG: DUF3795 domain-containing protein [Candidatus Bathyarchaeota archaeon]|nr:DUF3795 domain-containing protein [Candidatus Bathyarchaeota archaeon]